MKISELTSRRRSGSGLSPLQARVLAYIEEHGDEVFSYRDEAAAKQLSVKVSAFSFSLWALHRDGHIDREEVEGKVYFGSCEAIAELRARLGIAVPRDPFERARANLERIRSRVGNISAVELLDAVRGSWD